MPLFTPAQHEAYIQAKEAQAFKPSGIACAICHEVTPYANASDEMVFFQGDEVIHVSEQSPDWTRALCSDCHDRNIDHDQRMREYQEELESSVMEEGECQFCDKPIPPGDDCCQPCLDALTEIHCFPFDDEEEQEPEGEVCYVCEDVFLPYFELPRTEDGEKICGSCLESYDR